MSISTDLQQLWELLAPYLPYKVQVWHAAHGIGTLVGLPYGQVHERPLAEVHFEGKDCLDYYELSDVKPVLYSFEDFCTPVNKSIPGMAIGREWNSSIYRVRMEEDYEGMGRACVMDGFYIELSVSEHAFNARTLGDGLAAILRKHHFAVGLRPDQYVRKGTCLACPSCEQKGACHV